jgi:hypothetical protein
MHVLAIAKGYDAEMLHLKNFKESRERKIRLLFDRVAVNFINLAEIS